MKRVMILMMFAICATHAVEYSHRMIALGTDLANLVPDYETDLFRNPQILQKPLAGISHQPAYGYSYRIVPYPPIYVYVSPTPISLKLMTGNLGMMGEYWFDYRHDLELDTYGWLASTFQAYRLQDLWMSRMKRFVFNIYNDLDYSKVRYVTPANLVSTARDLEYIIRTQAAFPVRMNLVLDIKIGFGFYEHKSEMSNYAFYDQRVNLGLARIGLFCRKITAANDFTSWYFDIGSPLSNEEIDSLPYSLYSSVLEDERVFMLAAKTLVWRLGFARAIPVTSTSMFVMGLKNTFLIQSTGNVAAETGLRGIKNKISLPIGMEYSIAAITLRFGTKFFYDFRSLREGSEDSVAAQDIGHDLNYEYSFGFGWKPHRRLTLDLYNIGNLTALSNWGLYIKYTF